MLKTKVFARHVTSNPSASSEQSQVIDAGADFIARAHASVEAVRVARQVIVIKDHMLN